jgi:sialidase-1
MDTSYPFLKFFGCLKIIVNWVILVALLSIPASATEALTIKHFDFPALRGKEVNPVLGFTLNVDSLPELSKLEQIEVVLPEDSTFGGVTKLHLCRGTELTVDLASVIASATPSSGKVRLRPDQPVDVAGQTFWIAVTLADDADINARVVLELRAIQVNGENIKPADGSARANQRVGIALRQQGEDGSSAYRIPGLARSNAGTLIAVYDVRYKHCSDLPARIDVGVSRSRDDGQTWLPMQIVMTPASLGAEYASGGIGDPAVLVDQTTGRIWIAAIWGHNGIGWASSRPGLDPEDTGQLLMTFSDDDGLTWAPLNNLTQIIKDPAWRIFFIAPGAGISMQDGTLVFPAMFRAADGGDTQGKPFATILSSRDHGETWQVGTGAKIDTTESQVVELADGSLMLNCRDDRGSNRTVMITRDLGATWEAHPTDRRALEDPVCMAGLLRWEHPRYGDLLIFSNPASSTNRHNMTLKMSRDQGMSWPVGLNLRYDARPGSGYSCLAPAGDDHVGVLYEGRCEIYFLRIPLADFFR